MAGRATRGSPRLCGAVCGGSAGRAEQSLTDRGPKPIIQFIESYRPWVSEVTWVARLMRRDSRLCLKCEDCGQSLVETALLLPILLLLAFNAINFGYFFFVAVNLASAPRTGVQYSILGFATPGQFQLAVPGPPSSTASVSYLSYQDVNGVLPGYADARVQVCTLRLGVTGTGTAQRANCAQYGTGSETYTPAPDPEAPLFVLHRVDVVYEVDPLIPAFELPTPGGPISLALMPTLRFHRQVSMRAMD